MKIKEAFTQAIEKAFQAAEVIIEPRDKALVYASIAQALAQTGQFKNIETLSEIPASENLAAETVNEEAEDKPPEKPVLVTRESLRRTPKNGSKKNEIESLEETPVENLKDSSTQILEESSSDSDVMISEPENEWTDELMERYDEELEYIMTKVEELGETCINRYITEYSSGALKKFEDVTPANIEGFVFYLKSATEDNNLPF